MDIVTLYNLSALVGSLPMFDALHCYDKAEVVNIVMNVLADNPEHVCSTIIKAVRDYLNFSPLLYPVNSPL